MKKPLIALMPLWDKKLDSYWMLPGYAELIIKSGGVPVVLTFSDDTESVKEIADRFDGFVFTGGDDIATDRYGQQPVEQCGQPCAQRDSLEFALFSEVIKTDKPVLGICRGMQLMNVTFGGGMIQDIYAQKRATVGHKQDSSIRSQATHGAKLKEGSLMEQLLGKEPLGVNSYHHQAVDGVAPGFVASAVAADGIIEAMEHPEKNLYAVQWHPEEMYIRYPRFANLFRHLVETAAAQKK